MASINQMGGVPAINNIPQGYTPYYNAQTYYNVPNYSPAPNNGYIQRSPYENYLNGKGSLIEQTVPKGCCYSVAIENTGTTPALVQNVNCIVERTA